MTFSKLTELSNLITEKEAKRIEALKSLQILNTPDERIFDNVTELLATILNVPISLISLVDEKRQWFKSKHGLEVSETPREISFCTHAIQSEDKKEFIVENATNDDMFKDNPLVTGSPKIRFYVGIPLAFNNYLIGTLCAIDDKPRKLSNDELKIVKLLAEQLEIILSLRMKAIELSVNKSG